MELATAPRSEHRRAAPLADSDLVAAAIGSRAGDAGRLRAFLSACMLMDLPAVELRRSASPELTRRELDVLTSLCRPALSDEAFVAPASAREIATDLVVTEAAVKQHLLRLYQKFRIPEGPNRRVRLANEVVALGLVRPLPPAGRPELPGLRPPAGRPEPVTSRQAS